MRRMAAGFMLGFAVMALVGCGGGGPAAATVSGEIKVNGKPLAKGTIAFVSADAPGTPASAEVTAGRYEIHTTAGPKKVQVSAPVVTGKQREYNAPDAPFVEFTEEGLPPKYNTETELTLDVQAGSNTKDWSLDGIKGKK